MIKRLCLLWKARVYWAETDLCELVRTTRVGTSDQKVAGSSPAGCTNKIKVYVLVPSGPKSDLVQNLVHDYFRR